MTAAGPGKLTSLSNIPLIPPSEEPEADPPDDSLEAIAPINAPATKPIGPPAAPAAAPAPRRPPRQPLPPRRQQPRPPPPPRRPPVFRPLCRPGRLCPLGSPHLSSAPLCPAGRFCPAPPNRGGANRPASPNRSPLHSVRVCPSASKQILGVEGRCNFINRLANVGDDLFDFAAWHRRTDGRADLGPRQTVRTNRAWPEPQRPPAISLECASEPP